MEIVQSSDEAMLIIISNDEANQYMKWKPSANTVAYYPLETSAKDEISQNTPTYSRWTITYNGTSCQLSGWAFGWNLWSSFSFTSPRTIFQWLKPTNRRSYSARLWYPMQNSSSTWWFEIWETRTDMWWTHPRFWLTEWSWSWNQNNGWEMPLNERHCFVLVYTWTQLLCYRDWEVIDYSPIIWIGFNPTWTATFMRFSVNNNYDYYDWYVAHLWVEKVGRTQEEVVKFYKSFKDNFQ